MGGGFRTGRGIGSAHRDEAVGRGGTASARCPGFRASRFGGALNPKVGGLRSSPPACSHWREVSAAESHAEAPSTPRRKEILCGWRLGVLLCAVAWNQPAVPSPACLRPIRHSPCHSDNPPSPFALRTSALGLRRSARRTGAREDGMPLRISEPERSEAPRAGAGEREDGSREGGWGTASERFGQFAARSSGSGFRVSGFGWDCCRRLRFGLLRGRVCGGSVGRGGQKCKEFRQWGCGSRVDSLAGGRVSSPCRVLPTPFPGGSRPVSSGFPGCWPPWERRRRSPGSSVPLHCRRNWRAQT